MGLKAQKIKTKIGALDTVEIESGSAKYENWIWRPRYCRKRECKIWKLDPNTDLGAQNMKTGPGTLGTPNMGMKAQNMKTEIGALDTVENECGSAKYENWIWRPRYCRKRVRERKIWKLDPAPSVPPKTGTGEQNMKIEPDTLGTAEHGFGNEKHKNWTRRPRYHRKRLRKRKTWKLDTDPSIPPKSEWGVQNMKIRPRHP
jgi:hypothetical protein